jgi:hypothetical protein
MIERVYSVFIDVVAGNDRQICEPVHFEAKITHNIIIAKLSDDPVWKDNFRVTFLRFDPFPDANSSLLETNYMIF